jgi:hypothetical protein
MDQTVQQAFAVETQTLAKKVVDGPYIKIFLMTLVGMSVASAIFRHAAEARILLFLVTALFCVYRFMKMTQSSIR